LKRKRKKVSCYIFKYTLAGNNLDCLDLLGEEVNEEASPEIRKMKLILKKGYSYH
jgi:hypothetical protein